MGYGTCHSFHHATWSRKRSSPKLLMQMIIWTLICQCVKTFVLRYDTKLKDFLAEKTENLVADLSMILFNLI